VLDWLGVRTGDALHDTQHGLGVGTVREALLAILSHHAQLFQFWKQLLRWIEAASLIEPTRERQARELTIAKRAAFFLAPWLTLRAAQEALLTGAPVIPGGRSCGCTR
jgi:hypothetical protein